MEEKTLVIMDPMLIATHEFGFNGGLLQRGFWLYIWGEVPPTGISLHAGVRWAFAKHFSQLGRSIIKGKQ